MEIDFALLYNIDSPMIFTLLTFTLNNLTLLLTLNSCCFFSGLSFHNFTLITPKYVYQYVTNQNKWKKDTDRAVSFRLLIYQFIIFFFFSISENFGSTPAITNPMYMLLKPSPISLESSSHVKHKLDLEWNAQSYGTQSQEFLLMETYELTMFPSHKKVQV